MELSERSFDQANTCVSYRAVPALHQTPRAAPDAEDAAPLLPQMWISHLQTARVLTKAALPYGQEAVHVFL